MKKPTKAEFGYSRETGWQDERDIDLYYNALKAWENRPQPTTGGRQRSRPVHPSWESVLKHFDSTNPNKSQGAFCRWAGINRATFSSWQLQEVKKWVPDYVAIWLSEQTKDVESE